MSHMNHLPRLTQAQAPLIQHIRARDEQGQWQDVAIPAERALTVYVDKQELITLMTLGAHPEWLVLGYLRNQRLVQAVHEVESITVDWSAGDAEAGVAAVKTQSGVTDVRAHQDSRVVTTGCGQGSVYAGVMRDVDALQLPDACMPQSELFGIVNQIRLRDSTYKKSGSVHGCALFDGERLLLFVEDVGRHNAIDTLAGWMWMNQLQGHAGLRFYTTGRLTSEMIIKAAQMGVAVVISRSGITQMGYEMAQRLGVCAIGRALHQRYLVYTTVQRVVTPSMEPSTP